MIGCIGFPKSEVSTINVTTTAVTLVPDEPMTLVDKGRFGLRLMTAPTGGATLPVEATINGGAVNVFDRYGNIVYGNQLKAGQVIYGYFGTNGLGATPAHIIATKVITPGCA